MDGTLRNQHQRFALLAAAYGYPAAALLHFNQIEVPVIDNQLFPRRRLDDRLTLDFTPGQINETSRWYSGIVVGGR